MKEDNCSCQGGWLCPSCWDELDNENARLKKELDMYRNALTQAIARPMGVLPDCEQWYCVNLNGNIVVKSK